MMTREQLIWAISEMENDVDRKNIAAHDQAQRAVIVEKEEKLLVLERTIPVMNQMIEQQRLQTESDRHAYSLLNERCEQQAKRIQELEERLCIDYCYVHNPNDPTNPTKQTLTEDQKKTFPDKIYCLEADVQLRDEKIEQQAKEIEQWKAAAQMHNGVYEPLKQENKDLQKEITRLKELTAAWRNIQQEEMCYVMREIEALGIDINKAVIIDGKAPWDVCMERIAELRKAEKENKTLREALQLLYDTQNGCPLPKYEADWNRAMELAEQALKEVS